MCALMFILEFGNSSYIILNSNFLWHNNKNPNRYMYYIFWSIKTSTMNYSFNGKLNLMLTVLVCVQVQSRCFHSVVFSHSSWSHLKGSKIPHCTIPGLVNTEEHLAAEESDFSLRSWWRPKEKTAEERVIVGLTVHSSGEVSRLMIMLLRSCKEDMQRGHLWR